MKKIIKIIPAIDIKGGKVVRLFRGEFDKEKIYYKEPDVIAKKWEKEGAEIIHVVDLDGAKAGFPVNKSSIIDICKSVSIPIELGGGIRTFEDIKYFLSNGVNRLIIGTKAVEKKFLKNVIAEFGDKIVVGIDANNGVVALQGWEKFSSVEAVSLARLVERYGGERIIFTDISRDGTLNSPNFKEIKKMLSSITINVIASGGISNLSDVEKLIRMDLKNLEGIIIGKALYEGKISLKEVIGFTNSMQKIKNKNTSKISEL